MKKRKHIISQVESDSIAEELGVEAGDYLVSMNDKYLNDIFDYHYFANDTELTILIQKKNGEEWECEIEKDYDEDLGLIFEQGLMDEYHSCTNQCIFCFIDQMPPGMRDTLYFKDDDSRLSFLQGNYVTLTNMSDEDVDRIITYKLAPINISVHTTDPDLRCKMLHNRFAGESLYKIKRFYEAGIEMNAQIVLCKGINDQEKLEETIRELSEYLPYMRSLSVVPAGLTKYRKGLYSIEKITPADAKQALAIIQKYQKKCYEQHGLHFVHGSDELYLLAEEPFPEEEVYDGYCQLENGVGMIPLLESEFAEALQWHMGDACCARVVSIATGRLSAPLMRKLSMLFSLQYPNVTIIVHEITNHFFGEDITVSGLLTGQDLQAQLTDKELGEQLLLPCNMMRSGEEVFLDDMTKTELESALKVPIHIVGTSGQELFNGLKGE